MAVIYKITSPSSSIYIGQSHNFKQRLRSYKGMFCKKQPKLYNSFLKYGFDKHIIEIIHTLPKDTTVDILNTYEKIYYDFYRKCGSIMMNITEPGNNRLLSKETKQKLRLSRLGKNLSQETKDKISKANKGKVRLNISEEHKKNLSLSKKGYKFSEEAKRKMSLAKLGKSSLKKGIPSGRKGIPLTEEHKKNISKGHLKCYE